jgi:hypothetical protein
MSDDPKKDKSLWEEDHQDSSVLKKFFGIIIIIIIVIAAIIAIFILTMPPEKKIIYSDLRLDGVEVRRLDDTYIDDNTTSTDLEVIIYLTNDGLLDSGKIKIDAYVKSFDTRGVPTPCDSNGTINLGAISTDSTGKTSLQFNDLIVHHEERYTIDFYIWEDEKVVEQASTTIKVPNADVKPDPPVDSRNQDDDEPGKKDKKEEAMSFPGFEVVPLMISIIILLLIIRARRYKNAK